MKGSMVMKFLSLSRPEQQISFPLHRQLMIRKWNKVCVRGKILKERADRAFRRELDFLTLQILSKLSHDIIIT